MNSKTQHRLTKGIRCLIYSYMDFKTLMSRICRLSRQERKEICETELMDSDRPLKIKIGSGYKICLKNLKYLMKLSTSFCLEFKKFGMEEFYII